MNVAYLLQMPFLRPGGLEVVVQALIDETPKSDNIFLVSTDERSAIASSKYCGRISIHYKLPIGVLNRHTTLDLLRWVVDHKIDLCHFHLSGTYSWQTRYPWVCPITVLGNYGIPIITTNHSAYSYIHSLVPYRPLWKRCILALVDWPGKALQLFATNYEVSVSKHDFKRTKKTFPMFDHKLKLVYHSRLDENTQTKKQERSHVILNVGTIAFLKGQHILVEAFASIASEFPSWNLRLVGMKAQETCVKEIYRLIETNEITGRVHLDGPDPNPEEYIRSSEIYVQPSLIEGFGLALQEAMFHGSACVGSTTGGIPELISNRSTGMLYPVGNAAALADTLRCLIMSPKKRNLLGEAARLSIRERGMTRQSMRLEYETLYRSVLEAE